MLVNIRVYKTMTSFLNKRNEEHVVWKIFCLHFELIEASLGIF